MTDQRKIVEYTIVAEPPTKAPTGSKVAYRYDAFESRIEALLRDGYELYGPPFSIGETTRLAQALVLRGSF